MSLYGVIALLHKNAQSIIAFENRILKFELKIKTIDDEQTSSST